MLIKVLILTITLIKTSTTITESYAVKVFRFTETVSISLIQFH